MFVSYSPRHAGVLFACTAAGMLVGDTLAGRFVSQRWRDRLGPWMRLLPACPYLVFSSHPSLPAACVACAVASVGYSATLALAPGLRRVQSQQGEGIAPCVRSVESI
jgi:predicted MFS family arabinose efflux permease